MITIYCVRRAGEPPPPDGLAGPGGAPVRRVEEGVIGAWVSETARGYASPNLEVVRAHDSVVRAALRSATPVPVRFGTAYADEGMLRAALREREPELLAALDRVQGRVEMGLRVEWEVRDPSPLPIDAGAPVTSGRGYLDRRRMEFEAQEGLRDRAAALLDAVEARVASEGPPAVRTLLPASGVAGSMAHLVHRHAVGEFRRRVDEAQTELPDVRLRVSGPWAPYSFV